MLDIYSDLENEIKQIFTGEEEGREMQQKVVKLPRAFIKRLKDEVTKQLDVIPTVSEAVYCVLNKISSRPTKTCPVCQEQFNPSKFYSIKEGYKFHDNCSVKCRNKNPTYIASIEKTNLERYGHTSNMWGTTREKTKSKWLKTLGVDNPMKSEIIQDKAKATNLKKLGVEYPGQSNKCREKMIKTCITRYGDDQKFNKQKAKETSFEKYGVEYPMQHPPIFEKAQRYKRKKALLPSGKEYAYQGYENVGVNALLESGLTEEQIIISEPTKMPTIEYFNPVRGKQSYYFPDIYIPSENRLIEIKSTWTMKDQLQENLAKHTAAKALGLNHEIWICTAKKILEIIL